MKILLLLAFACAGVVSSAQAALPATAGWYAIPNTKLHSVCPPDNFGGEAYLFNYYCKNVVPDWNSGVMDTTRNRLIVWGGGHNSYAGNELYAVNLNDQTIQRLNNPSIPTNNRGACSVVALADGSANSRHTYDGIAYMQNIDAMFVFGGAPTCLAGGFTTDTWVFKFATMTWQRMNPTGTIPRPDSGIVTAYDPNTGKVFLHDVWSLFSYDYATNTMQKLVGNYQRDNHMTAVIDPVRKKFVIVGKGQAWIYDIGPNSTYTRQALVTTGGSVITNSLFPGLAYDSVSDRIVAWNGGDTVYSLNLDTNVWTPTTYAGGPGAAPVNGTYKRWSYAPASGVFVLVNSMDQNAYVLRTGEAPPPPADTTPDPFSFAPAGLALNTEVTSAAITVSGINAATAISITGGSYSVNGAAYTTAAGTVNNGNTVSVLLTTSGSYSTQTCATLTIGGVSGLFCATTMAAPPVASAPGVSNFAIRCAQPGVVKCVGFDDVADFNIGTGGTRGAYGLNSGIYPPYGTADYTRAVRDTSIRASGGSSLRFTIPSNTGADTSGSYFTNFSSDLSIQFDGGQEFFVQWRQRFSPEFLSTVFTGGGWKQAIIGTGDQPGKLYSSCTAIHLVMQNAYQRGFPQMYNSCTGSTSHGPYDPFEERFGSDYKLQNGRPTPYCLYSQKYTSYFPPIGNCFGYVANEWMTFQMKVKLGLRVGDEFQGSYVTLWGAREGKASEVLFQWGPYNLTAGVVGTNQRFGKVWLLPYNTGKAASQVHPTAYTWYDELIISRNKIADPA